MNITRETAIIFEKGKAALGSGQYALAVELFISVLNRVPAFAPGHNALGLAFAGLGRTFDALASYETAMRTDPSFAAPYINRATLLRDCGDLDAARISLDKAVQLQPSDPIAHGNRGSLLMDMGEPGEAAASFTRALALDPSFPYARGLRLISKAYVCDWAEMDADLLALQAQIQGGAPATPPWPLLTLIDSPELHRRVTECWVNAKFPPDDDLGPIRTYPDHERIKIGYFCADFHRHPTGHLIAGLFESHHRSKFEIFAFSLRRVRNDDMHKRIVGAVDRFIDVSGDSDKDVATLSRSLEIDIAVDLNGLITNNRMGIFRFRAAPVQVNYLAYPSTLGASYMDYIIADHVVAPDAAFYTERVVRLPDCYQVNDGQRHASDRQFTRAELGLPESGFVFCCFNNNFKIMPHMFDVWMRILRAVDGSVLWLLEDSSAAAANLCREAERRDVDRNRLVFAKRVQQEDHLARQAAADLFLDTLPYNAHTTASDALWVGLPVLTCMGDSFASRVSASLLRAIDLPELIASTLVDYETLAISLARDPGRFADLKERLRVNRKSSRLFDLERFTLNIEAAYTRMFADCRAD